MLKRLGGSRFVHPGGRTGRCRLGGDELLVDENGDSEISAEDCAIGVADLLEQEIATRKDDRRE